MDASTRLDDTAMPIADETHNASASDNGPANSQEPLPITLELALAHVAKVTKAIGDADKHAISAGLRFREIKQRVQSGEAGKGVSWADYCAAHIPSPSQRTVDTYIRALTHKDTEEELRQSFVASLPVLSVALRLDPETVSMDKEEADAFSRCKYPYVIWGAFHGFTGTMELVERWEKLSRGDQHTFQTEIERVSDWLRSIGKTWADESSSFAPGNDDAKPTSSAKRGTFTEDLKRERDQRRQTAAAEAKRRQQNAEAQARRRAKSSAIREASGGKASKPRQDRETAEQYSRLAMMAKVLDAGQLQIINEIIEERWPGTEAKAKAAKAERDKAA